MDLLLYQIKAGATPMGWCAAAQPGKGVRRIRVIRVLINPPTISQHYVFPPLHL